MSSIQIPRVLSQRGKNQLEIERENFERHQAASLQKAINATEAPVKEKHVRTAIIGTFHDKNASVFWSLVTKQPLQGNPIVCWKFLHVLHKLLREGFPQAISDSQKYCSFITDLGKLWGHLREGYGRLIAFYSKLIVQKLTFHKKYPQIPGNMMLEEGELDKVCGNDINQYFELSVDMLDYLDDILALQTQVFGSLDMSRSNSMTSTGQCRLAPLIQCIQDSCQLYDYIVKILFRLHSSLPPDTLSGHRDRFYAQYKILKKFYYSSSNLQYFKNLIKVPILPENPPNFLVASDLNSHVTPVVIVPDPEAAYTPGDEASAMDLLVDTSSICSEEPPQFDDTFGQNGAPSPPMPDDRDMLIDKLMREINELKAELVRVKAEDGMMIESLNNRIRELEDELNELKQIAESTQDENETLKNVLKETEHHSQAATRLFEVERQAKVNEERAKAQEDKFKKMKDIYTKLREEHVQLLRSNADIKKELGAEKRVREDLEQMQQTLSQEVQELRVESSQVHSTLEQSCTESAAQLASAAAQQQHLEDQKQDLSNQLLDIEAAKASLEGALAKTEADLEALQKDLEQAAKDRKASEEILRFQMMDKQHQLLVSAVEEGEVIIQDGLDQFDNPHLSAVTCTAEYLLSQSEPVLSSLDQLKQTHNNYTADKQAVGPIIKTICDFAHRLAAVIVHGKATANSAPIESGDELTTTCRKSGEESLALLGLIKNGTSQGVPDQVEKVQVVVKALMAQAEVLVPKIEDVKAEQMGDLIEQEMAFTTNAIEQAAAKIADMLAKSREAQTGIQLEVNERILDSCTNLMKAIKELIIKSKSLQREIVSQGRGASSAKEFYKRHHRWTEGLISAAKAVGWGANVLVDAADKCSRGEGKFQELMVCAQEIAASTTQLVVSSKVKSDRKSTALGQVLEASKHVTQATGEVVASAKSGAQMIEELEILDFSKLSLTQAKRFEMDSQVRVLELESDLEKERVRLAELRKKHYQLAGASEGWEQEDIDSQA